MNQILLEKVQCMLSNIKLGRQFWAEAMRYTSHLINCLSSTTISSKTPLEIWFGKLVANYDSLCIFCSIIYYYVKELKLDLRAKKTLFIWITIGVKGYCLWYPEIKQIIFSRDITFDKPITLKKVIKNYIQQII